MPTTHDHIPELSVVVLCYRAGYYINDFVAQLRTELTDAAIDFELVLVANYDKNSNDNTPGLAKQLAAADSRLVVVSKEKEGRMGWDMRSGLEAARGHYIGVIDGDGQMPVSDVVKVYQMLKAGQYDLVKTYRAKRFDGFYRNILSAGYNWLFKLLFMPGYPLHDINSKPKVMTREAYQRLQLISSDWFTDAEIMIEALQAKMKIGEVSTVFYRNDRRNTFVGFATVWEFIGNLFYYRFVKKQR